MVFARRFQYRLAARARSHHLGRMTVPSETGPITIGHNVGHPVSIDQINAAGCCAPIPGAAHVGLERRRNQAGAAACQRSSSSTSPMAGRLSQLYQRSADLFWVCRSSPAMRCSPVATGVSRRGSSGPVATATSDNHVEQVRLQLSREPRPYPKLLLADQDSIFRSTYEDIVVKNYDPHPAIKAPVAV